MSSGNERIARGWDEAAIGYDDYFVPRFAPWVTASVAAIATPDLPPGPILVPCCGTFPELDPLLAAWPDRKIIGIDLSRGMINRAQVRIAGRADVEAVVGDAARLDPGWTESCAAVVSNFGLQQLPEPAGALQSWLSALRPGGRLSVTYWPERTESDGPFARIAAAVQGQQPFDDSWEHDLVPALLTRGAVVRDEYPAFPMFHPDAATFFDAYVENGPLRAKADSNGQSFVTTLRREFLQDSPRGVWRHQPHARHLVAEIPTGTRRAGVAVQVA